MGMNEFGKDWRIKFGDGAETEAFNIIGGETTLDWKRSSQEIDLSDKDSGIYGSTAYGQQKITFSVSGNLKLPDVGLSAAFAASKASPPEINVEIVKGALVKFKGLVSIGNFSSSFPTTGAATFSFDMVNVGAPDTDALDAAS